MQIKMIKSAFVVFFIMGILSVIIFFLYGKQESDNVSKTRIYYNSDCFKTVSPLKSNLNYRIQCETDYHFIVYYDSTRCFSCEISKMHQWDDIINKTYNLNASVDFSFVFSVSKCDVEEAQEFYNVSRFSYPIYLDIDGAFEKNNKILRNSLYHSFIIDKYGKIVYVGDPSKKLNAQERYDLFLKEITKNR